MKLKHWQKFSINLSGSDNDSFRSCQNIPAMLFILLFKTNNKKTNTKKETGACASTATSSEYSSENAARSGAEDISKSTKTMDCIVDERQLSLNKTDKKWEIVLKLKKPFAGSQFL